MKTLTRTILPSFVLLALAIAAVSAEPRIGVIDLRKVFDDYYKTQAADAKLKEEAADLDKERKTLLDQYQKTTDEYKKALDNANNQAVSADEREKGKKTAEGKLLEIKELEQSITQFDRQARTTLDEKQRRMRDSILSEIRTVINSVAKNKTFTLVVDTAAESINKTPIVMYNSGENDITEAVLAQLNANAPPGTLKNSDKPKADGKK